jgi:hypothetical protein
MSKKIEKELDFAEYEIDEPEESKAAAEAAVNAAAAKVVKKAADVCNEEESDVVKKLRADLAAAQLALAAKSAPLPRVKYDHETTKKNLVKNTAPVCVLMETHKEDYESVYYMWSLCDYWKSLMPLDHAQNNEHVAFIKYFRKERHLYGLPAFVPATPSPQGSKTSSRAASVALNESINEEEDEGAGAA